VWRSLNVLLEEATSKLSIVIHGCSVFQSTDDSSHVFGGGGGGGI
jgi:hypothetical protein